MHPGCVPLNTKRNPLFHVDMPSRLTASLRRISSSADARDVKICGPIPLRTKYGASPRASIYLAIAAKAFAFLQGRGYVTPQDVKTIGMDVLRHRVIITYEAEAEEMTSEDVIQKVFDEVPVP